MVVALAATIVRMRMTTVIPVGRTSRHRTGESVSTMECAIIAVDNMMITAFGLTLPT